MRHLRGTWFFHQNWGLRFRNWQTRQAAAISIPSRQQCHTAPGPGTLLNWPLSLKHMMIIRRLQFRLSTKFVMAFCEEVVIFVIGFQLFKKLNLVVYVLAPMLHKKTNKTGLNHRKFQKLPLTSFETMLT
jgi:hypothetical protein